MSQVIIGMDPHKRSATIEVMASDETVVGGGRYGTDAAGYRAMLAEAKRWLERTWAIEGCQGIGRHIGGPPSLTPRLSCRRAPTPVGWPATTNSSGPSRP